MEFFEVVVTVIFCVNRNRKVERICSLRFETQVGVEADYGEEKMTRIAYYRTRMTICDSRRKDLRLEMFCEQRKDFGPSEC